MAKKKGKDSKSLINTLASMAAAEEDTIPEEEEEEPTAPVGKTRKEGEYPEEETPKEEPKIKEKEMNFVDFIEAVNEALKSKEGLKLNCRVRVVVTGKEAFIYQGLRHNIWARLFKDKKHLIYRYTLRRLLTTHTATKDYFTADKIRV